jgi:predicted ThiF/HesA family dinucleotide-utilizing enzyme
LVEERQRFVVVDAIELVEGRLRFVVAVDVVELQAGGPRRVVVDGVRLRTV